MEKGLSALKTTATKKEPNSPLDFLRANLVSRLVWYLYRWCEGGGCALVCLELLFL